MEAKTLQRLLRLTLLFVSLTAATTLPNLEVDHLSANEHSALLRSKRRVGTSSSALQYMEKLRDSLSDEQGKPTLANSDDPTEVWGIQDIGKFKGAWLKLCNRAWMINCIMQAILVFTIFLSITDILNDGFRTKPRSGERCAAMNKFIFSWKTLSESAYSKTLPVEKATLRAYMKVIRRLLNRNGPTSVRMDVHMKSRDHNSSLGVEAGQLQLSVTAHSASWVEINISEGVKRLWPPKSGETHVEVTVVFRTDKCKVPVIFEDPTTIPLRQVRRRQRLSALQPLFLVYLNDEKVKETIRNETTSFGDDSEYNDDVAGAESGPERRKRDTSEAACTIEDFKVVFRDLRINYVYAPYSYNARQCRGSCSHNMLGSRGQLANNHAKIMASAKLMSDRKLAPFLQEPKGPCCVPTKYSALTLVIPQQDGSIKFVVYSHMTVEECRCR